MSVGADDLGSALGQVTHKLAVVFFGSRDGQIHYRFKQDRRGIAKTGLRVLRGLAPLIDPNPLALMRIVGCLLVFPRLGGGKQGVLAKGA